MPLRLIADAGNGDNTDKRPLLVSISARALSSVGFGLSIIAIWMQWLFPCDEAGLIHYVRQPGRQLSPSQHGTFRSTAHFPRHTKHVSFADAKKRHRATRQTIDVATPNPHPLVPDESPVVIPIPRSKSPQPIAHNVTVAATAASSSSTIAQSVDEKKTDGDLPSFPSPSPIPSKLPSPTEAAQKSEGFFARRNPCKKRRTGSLNEKLLESSQSRERCSRATSLKLPLGKLSSRALPRSATFSFGTRQSRPVPRTMPYGPPYFATPPWPIDDAPSDSSRKSGRNAT